MARAKNTVFTDVMIRKLKPADQKYIRSEGNGFTIRVLPSGRKPWLYIYSFEGKRRELSLGTYPEVTLETARSRFEAARLKVKNGIDPIAEHEAEAEARRNAPTMKDLCEEYVERHAKRFKRTWEEDRRILNRDVLPAWGSRKAADIVKRDVIKLLEGIVDRGSPGMANNTFQVVRKMFNFAVERDIIRFTPCAGLKLPSPKNARDRVLSDQEIRTVWHNLEECAISDHMKYALRLTLVTAQRPGEVIRLHTSEIDGGWWHKSAAQTKNATAHRVPLSPLALEIIAQAVAKTKLLRGLRDEEEYSGYIFPSPRYLEGEKPMTQHSMIIAVARGLGRPVVSGKGKRPVDPDEPQPTANTLGVPPFTPHDLRRTAATCMAEAGEMDEVIDAILNHVKQGVIKVYNLYRYDKEKRLALESWARKLTSIISGKPSGKVISLLHGR